MLHKKILIILLLLTGSLLISCAQNSTMEVTTQDMSPYPNFVSDVSSVSYSFTPKDVMAPFWKGNVMMNETVLLIEDNGEISGNLLYEPIEIIAVKDFSLQTTFVEGSDYEVDGRRIRKLTASTIPSLKKENLTGQNIPEPYQRVNSIANVLTDYVLMGPNAVYTESPFWYGSQISVSYVYDFQDLNLDSFPGFAGNELPNTLQKLTSGESLRITGIGDSVLEGCSSSKKFNHEPYLDDFLTLTESGLEYYYDLDVTLNNLSVGGKTSLWGSSPSVINDIKNSNPDLVIIHFGINDAGDGASPNSYRDNIELIILSVREALPNTEFILLTSFTPNPLVYDAIRLEDYWSRLNTLANNHTGVHVIDLYKASIEILAFKKYEDVTGNGINHVNDFASRVYLMGILSSLVSNETILSKEE
ncbi:MAG: SGNH/GDSL hydrolase family protein [Candidatus Izemoplasmatales bacterium]